jgi:Tfp pilus assembly protein PilW
MLGRESIDIRDERGSSMVELLVGLAMGMIVLVGLTMTIIVTLHGTSRVDARVEATDNARVAVTRIMEELHSACVSPQIAPVQEKSSGNSLIFWHAAAGQTTAVEPLPVKSKITYSGGTLTQTDYAQTGGTSPNWVFSTTGSERRLLSNVAPAAGSSVPFSYYKYESGSLVRLAAAELSKTEAEAVIVVKVALAASPRSTPVADAGAAATVQDSATLRLTPPSFNEGASALPCQ